MWTDISGGAAIAATSSCCSSHLKNVEELSFRVCFSFFSTQNQVPQIFIEMGRVIYRFEALPVVIRTTLKI